MFARREVGFVELAWAPQAGTMLYLPGAGLALFFSA
jgi:hypothetical protein